MEGYKRENGPVKRRGPPWKASSPAKRKAEDQVSGIFFVKNLEKNFKELLSEDPINQIGDVIEVKSGEEYPLFACVEDLPTSPKANRFFRIKNYLNLKSIEVNMPGIILTQGNKLSAVSGKAITGEVPGFSEAEFKEAVAQRPAPCVRRTLMRINIPTIDVKTATSLPKKQSVLCLKAFTQMVKDQKKDESPGVVITLSDQSCNVPLKVLIKGDHLDSIGHIPQKDEVVCLHWFETYRGESQPTSMLISTEKSLIEIVRDGATLEGLNSLKSVVPGQRVEGEILECSMGTYLACPNRKCHLKKVQRIQGQEDLWECSKCDQQYKKAELAEGSRMPLTSEGPNGEITEWVMFTQAIAPYVRDGTEASELPTEIVGQRFTASSSGNVLNDVNITI